VRCSAYFAATVRRPPITVAISTAGETPALARLVREIVEGVLPADRWIAAARALRARWRAEGTPMEDRFPSLVAAISGARAASAGRDEPDEPEHDRRGR
jgi:siroheme synthase (precorrin-2 oxidase/ferrochelatase)